MHFLLRKIRAFARSECGNVAIVTAAALPVFVGFTGLGVESGYWYFEQRRMQAAADVAAYAGAVTVRSGKAQADVVATATSEAAANGFRSVAGEISVNWPPADGDNLNPRSVEVVIQQTYDRLFLTRFASETVTVSARAVSTFDEPNSACLIALNELDSRTLQVSGSAGATFTGCTLMANSLADDAFSLTGSGGVTAPCVASAGGTNITGDLVLTGCPALRQRMPRAPDPYAELPPPDTSGPCVSGGSGSTISPGKYCGNLDLRGDVVLDPGVYIVSGGTLSINANANVSGTGVTLYLTDGASLRINGTPELNLSAPTEGPYRDLLIYAGETASTADAVLNGTADSVLDGAIYMPHQSVEIRGDFAGGAVPTCTRIVADTINITGSARFTSNCENRDYAAVTAPSPVRLVE